MRYVYRFWLWYGMLAGSLGWWLISLTSYQANDFRGIYLAILTYFILAIPTFDWFLVKGEAEHESSTIKGGSLFQKYTSPLQTGLILIILAFVFSIGFRSFSEQAFFLWAPFTALLVWVGAYRRSLIFLPWLSLILQWFAWLYCGLDYSDGSIQYRGLSMELQRAFLLYGFGMVAVYSGLTALAFFKRSFSHVATSMISLAPVLWFALAYLLVTDLSVKWEWGVVGVVLGFLYLLFAGWKLKEKPNHKSAVWLIMAAHFSVSLAAAMFLREASLTLVFGVQIISLVYLMQRFGVIELRWFIKGMLAIIVVRLTCNPWLLQYPADVHWSLWTYGGVTLCCGFAAWKVDSAMKLKRWLEVVTLHLLVLFLAAETRYWLYDGAIFIEEYTLTEAAINTMLWAGIGLVYFYRARISEQMATYYTICSRVLMCLALANYGLVLTHLNPIWDYNVISATPIWNLLLISYGGPVILSILTYLFYEEQFKRFAAMAIGLSLFVFISLEIRHIWQPVMSINIPVSDGELYTYSIVWLAMAIVTILLSAKIDQNRLYKAGMGLLIIVIMKIFFIDMSDLQGLLRVASFMGLGLSLLGLAYVHQKITGINDHQED